MYLKKSRIEYKPKNSIDLVAGITEQFQESISPQNIIQRKMWHHTVQYSEKLLY